MPSTTTVQNSDSSSDSHSSSALTHLPTSVPIIASTLCLPLESTYLIHEPSRPQQDPTTVCDLQGHEIFRFDPLHRSRSGRPSAAMYHAALPESPLLTIRKSINIVPWFSSSTYAVYPGGSGRARSDSSWSSLSSIERHAAREAPGMKVTVHRPRAPWKKHLTVTAVAPGSGVSFYVPADVGSSGEFEVMMLVHGEARSQPVARVRRCGGSSGSHGDKRHSMLGGGTTLLVDVANGLDIGAVCALVVIVNVYARS